MRAYTEMIKAQMHEGTWAFFFFQNTFLHTNYDA